MRKMMIALAALLCVLSCTREITIEHSIQAEFSKQEKWTSVSVLFGDQGTADIRISSAGVVTSALPGLTQTPLSGGVLVRWSNLAIVYGNFDGSVIQDLLENTFWKEPSLGWVFHLPSASLVMENAGFVDCLRARDLSDAGARIYAGNQVYDKISALSQSPYSFTVKVKEVE